MNFTPNIKEFHDIKEFHEKQMNITEQQEKYIKEEVVADYCSEQTSIIFEEHNRLASVKEHIAIHKDAYRKAEYIIIRKKKMISLKNGL